MRLKEILIDENGEDCYRVSKRALGVLGITFESLLEFEIPELKGEDSG